MRIYPLILLLLLGGVLPGQTLPLTILGQLPSSISESSGLTGTSGTLLWTHNDSGNLPELYAIDSLGSLTGTISVQNSSQKDWEDLTLDAQGNLFIGDFGNNGNSRQDLVIYRLVAPAGGGSGSVSAGSIHFSYPDQSAFPPPDSAKKFDMEAMVAAGDSLYLFSKNRTDPYDGFTRMYRLPKDTGTYVAELLDSFYTGPGPSINDWVTGAALSPNQDRLVLLSHGQLWLFTCFNGRDFFGGTVQNLNLSNFSQKEAVTFIGETELRLTDEELFPLPGRNLYQTDLYPYTGDPVSALGPDTVVVGDSLILNAGAGPFGYLWNTGETTAELVVTQSGSYTVTLNSPDGCGSTTDTIKVIILPTERAGSFPDGSIRLQSNPGTTLGLKFSRFPASKLKISLLDLQGRLVAEAKHQVVGNKLFSEEELWGSLSLPNGVYLVQVAGENGHWSGKWLRDSSK